MREQSRGGIFVPSYSRIDNMLFDDAVWDICNDCSTKWIGTDTCPICGQKDHPDSLDVIKTVCKPLPDATGFPE